jgi:hypothetical protein
MEESMGSLSTLCLPAAAGIRVEEAAETGAIPTAVLIPDKTLRSTTHIDMHRKPDIGLSIPCQTLCGDEQTGHCA